MEAYECVSREESIGQKCMYFTKGLKMMTEWMILFLLPIHLVFFGR